MKNWKVNNATAQRDDDDDDEWDGVKASKKKTPLLERTREEKEMQYIFMP